MRKIREAYQQTKSNAKYNFNKITQESMKKILSDCEKEINKINPKDDSEDLLQIYFYIEKFQNIVELFDKSIKEGTRKGVLENKIMEILKNDYVPQNQGQVERKEARQNRVGGHPRVQSSQSGRPQTSKDNIQSYLDKKSNEIQKIKIGMKIIQQQMSFSPKKIPAIHSKIKNSPDPSQQIKEQLQRLKKELKSKQKENTKDLKQIQHQKKQLQDRIQELRNQLNKLQQQNKRLKVGQVKKVSIYDNYTPNVQEQEEFRMYYTKFRQNDINKIWNKAWLLTQQRQANKLEKSLEENKILSVTQQSPKQFYDIPMIKVLEILQPDKREHDAQNITLKSKLSFFKQSMIIYRSQQFEIAVKTSDIIQLELKKIIIYVNNKSNLKKEVKLEYKYDKNYYEIKTTKKMTELSGLSQGKEQLEVKLINQKDFDSLAEVNMKIDDKQFSFVLPVMFIEFVGKKPLLDGRTKYTSLKVKPIHQFSHYRQAEQLIPLEKIYGQLYETGKVYAISKHHKGYITLKWIGGRVEVETIPQWNLFISYLLLKES